MVREEGKNIFSRYKLVVLRATGDKESRREAHMLSFDFLPGTWTTDDR